MFAANRWQTFSHAVAFVLGFSTVFVILGASVAFFGYALNQYLPTFVKLGGLMLILFGLQVIGAFGWIADWLRRKGLDDSLPGRAFIWFTDGLSRVMYTEGRVQVHTQHSVSYVSSFLMGVFFSAGWIPCVGPVLAAIYLLASDTQTVAQGALLLAVYSAGLGIPFLITGLMFHWIAPYLKRMNRHLGIVSKVTGAFLILVGVLLFMDRLALLSNTFVARFGTGLAGLELGGAGLSTAVTLPIAFFAGLLSFLSPCVLPLIPAYIGYLSGTVVAEGGSTPVRA